jgi:ferredoxin-NADP reductase
MTPAMSALRRVARTRSVAAEVLLEGARDDDDETAHRYADELRKLLREHPAAASWNAIELLERDARPFVREVGELWRSVLEQRQRDGLPTDLGIF